MTYSVFSCGIVRKIVEKYCTMWYYCFGGGNMFKINPYRPGAGLKPLFLAGRDKLIEEMDNRFQCLCNNVPISSTIYSGLRGVGKTVLLNQLKDIAEEYEISCVYIEIEERNNFIPQISTCMQSFLREISIKEKMKSFINKAVDAIKTLQISFDPESQSFSIGVNDVDLYKSNSLIQSLTDMFVAVGKIAQKAEMPLCLFIDEIQYMKQEELGALIAAIHRINQLGYPIMVVGAGLPKIYKMLSDEKSYSERLFSYREVDSLTMNQSIKAIVEPAKKFNVTYDNDVLEKIFNITKGYPFFVQQFCQIIYNNTDKKNITMSDFENSINEYYAEIDAGLYNVRYERCSETDKLFIFAMVKCGELPCTISNIASNLGKSTSSISPARAQLISKGIIYPIRYKELDFTVPDFDGFIRRKKEYKEWVDG